MKTWKVDLAKDMQEAVQAWDSSPSKSRIFVRTELCRLEQSSPDWASWRALHRILKAATRGIRKAKRPVGVKSDE